MSDPFGDPRFVSNHMLWIETLNADAFRAKIQALGLLTSIQEIADLKLKQTNGGNPAHNSHVISLINPGGNLAYKCLCQAIYSMNPILHTAKFNEMILLLPEHQRPAIGSFPAGAAPGAAGAGVAAGAAAAASDNWPQGQKCLSHVTDWKGFSKCLEKCVSPLNRENFAQAVAVLIDPDNANDFKDTIQDFIKCNDHGSTELQANLYGVIRWAVSESEMRDVTLAELEKIALRLNPDKKNRIHSTFRVKTW
ncbi:uncharacterized protein LOC135828399 [Sycon ciliatum]|uniref:uncharacterized protein LOC135828399 n=1 Tax=Sycon ciliatum TaxID=27933 RepID=UPI0031F65828